jgi:hypothetical protein
LNLYGMGFPNRSMERRGDPTEATVPPSVPVFRSRQHADC